MTEKEIHREEIQKKKKDWENLNNKTFLKQIIIVSLSK